MTKFLKRVDDLGLAFRSCRSQTQFTRMGVGRRTLSLTVAFRHVDLPYLLHPHHRRFTSSYRRFLQNIGSFSEFAEPLMQKGSVDSGYFGTAVIWSRLRETPMLRTLYWGAKPPTINYRPDFVRVSASTLFPRNLIFPRNIQFPRNRVTIGRSHSAFEHPLASPPATIISVCGL